LLRQAIAQFRAGGDKLRVASALSFLGINLSNQDRTSESMATYQESIALLKELGKADGVRVLTTDLGAMLIRAGRPGEAATILEPHLQVCRDAKDGFQELTVIGNLAAAYDRLGRFRESVSMNETFLAGARKGGFRDKELNALSNLVVTCTTLGDFARAMKAGEDGLELARKLGARTVLGSLELNVGRLHDRLGDLPRAMAHYQRSLAIRREVGDRRGEGICLRNISALQSNLGRTKEALETGLQAVTLVRTLGLPTDLVEALTNLSTYQRKAGNLSGAETSLQEALTTSEAQKNPQLLALARAERGVLLMGRQSWEEAAEALQSSAEGHRSLGDREAWSKATLDLTLAGARLGRTAQVEAGFTALHAYREEALETTFASLSERERLNYARTFEGQVHSQVAHALDRGGQVLAAYEAWLGMKGRVMEAQGRLHAAVLASPDPRIRQNAERLQEVRTTLALLLQSRPAGLTQAQHQTRLEELRVAKEVLEKELVTLSQAFAREHLRRRPTLESVLRHLPEKAVLLDFTRIRPRLPEQDKIGPARYAAFVIRSGQPLRLIDLGPAEPVDAQIRALRQDIQAGEPLEEPIRLLKQRLLEPLRGSLSGAERLLVSPDGELNLVPFELLVTPGKGAPVLSYLGAAPDLLRLAERAPRTTGAVVFAGPDFGPSSAAAGGERGDAFAPLPGTLAEARVIEQVLGRRKCQVWTGPEASADRLRGLTAPRILHIATHGYFLPRRAEAEGWDLDAPMARSGLALSGANQPGSAGQVSATAILDLNLQGTDLVTLSACSTGIGQILDGEGVFGLRRAFTLAGARSLLVSLWPVPDDSTQALMTAFYQRLAKGVPKALALAEAKRRVARTHPHPRHWAGFILVGATD